MELADLGAIQDALNGRRAGLEMEELAFLAAEALIGLVCPITEIRTHLLVRPRFHTGILPDDRLPQKQVGHTGSRY